MYTVYVLRSLSNGKFYVSFTDNIERRVKEHNAGKSKFTSGHRPWQLIYSEQAPDRLSARAREKYLKSAAGKRFLKHKIDCGGSLPD